jgi:HSP20 family protein
MNLWHGWPFSRPDVAVEQFEEDGVFVVRIEAPDIDPDRDAVVMVADGELKVEIQRVAWVPEPKHTEFHYGPTRRVIQLPRAARDETVTATYDRGILEVRCDLSPPVPIGRTVPIRHGPIRHRGGD